MSHLYPTSFAGGYGPVRRGRGAFRLFALLSLFALVCGGLVMTPTAARASSVSITTSDVNLRSGPGTEFSVILAIPPAYPVTITGDPENGYYPVNYNGTDGWAAGDYIVFSSNDPNIDGGATSATGDAWVVDGALNLRSGPSLDASVITVMPGDAQVTLTGTLNNGYFSVNYQGTDGWAFALYLSTSGSAGNSSASASEPVDSTVSSGPTGTAWVIDGTLNLRAGPGTDNGVVTVMSGGAQVTLTGQSSNGFDSVNYNGTDGWADAAYLSTTQPSSSSGASADSGNASSGNASNGNASSSSDSDIVSIINAAADKYGQPRADMLRVATCESNLDPNAVNPVSGTSGLFQFMPSTWASTPYADQSIFDATANANAAGWMWSVGRRNEWTCQ